MKLSEKSGTRARVSKTTKIKQKLKLKVKKEKKKSSVGE